MKKFYRQIVNHPKTILITFILLALISLPIRNLVGVDYDIKDYLPDDASSTIALDQMEAEFDGGIPNARVMVRNVTIPEALEYKEKLLAVDGVTDVLWLDDAADIYESIETIDESTMDTYYKDDNALFTVTIEQDKRIEAVAAIREIIGDENSMSGEAVSSAIATTSTVSEVSMVSGFAVAFVFLVLVLTTTSWIEPIIVLAGLGVAIAINSGTNIIFGEISFVTNAAGNILQLAVSLDYSVFLIHRFEECLTEIDDPKEAMVEALAKSTTSILSSGLTTVIGFVALVFMRFRIGPDLGLALAKGVVISLITVFIMMPVLILALHRPLQKFQHRSFMPDFTFLGKIVFRVTIPLVFVFLLTVVPSFLASNANEFYYGNSYIFGEETQLGSDIQQIEDVYGKRDTWVLMVPKGDLAQEKALSDTIQEIPQIHSVLSYVDTVGAEIPMEYLEDDTLSQLVSEHYSRMVLTVDANYEGDDTFALVEQVRTIAQEFYPDEYYLAGEGVSTYDLMESITSDTLKVNLIAIFAVFLVLAIMMKSVLLPLILVISIETAIWINLSLPYFTNQAVFYISYLIISSIQLGATVDYAILFTDRYREFRETMEKKEATQKTVASVTVSILTSGSVLTVVGFLLGGFSSHGILSQLGIFLGQGGLLSMGIVLFVLPGLLFLSDDLTVRRKQRKAKLKAELKAQREHLKEDLKEKEEQLKKRKEQIKEIHSSEVAK
jgi:hypothetical protein